MKLYCNPLDENSTLNMDNGSGNLTNTKNKSGGSFRNKGNNILPPTTNVRLNAAGRQVMNANVAGGGEAYTTYSGAGGDGSIPNAYPKCKHIEGEMEEYDNLGMYHIASGVCKKCGMSMVDWDKNNMDNGGRKHNGKATPKVHLSKRKELQQLLHSKFHNIVQIHVIEGGHKDVEIEAEVAEVAYDWHVSEMKKLLNLIKKECEDILHKEKLDFFFNFTGVLRGENLNSLNNRSNKEAISYNTGAIEQSQKIYKLITELKKELGK